MDETNITEAQIERLSTQAAEHGDLVQVALCYIALGWTIHDIAEECGHAIREELAGWDHVWANQIRSGTEDGRALARVLCYRAMGDQS